jgi:Uma2 family endonuclease
VLRAEQVLLGQQQLRQDGGSCCLQRLASPGCPGRGRRNQGGVTVVDGAWLERLAVLADAKVEVDEDGGVVVSPASDRHVVAATRLAVQLAAPVGDEHEVVVEGPRWSPLGGPAPSYVPDLAIVAKRALGRAEGEYRLDPPPLLVVEILSPATRRRDLGEKERNYFLGGALGYWTIELPGLADVAVTLLQVRSRARDTWRPSSPPLSGRVDVSGVLPFARPLTVDVDRLA